MLHAMSHSVLSAVQPETTAPGDPHVSTSLGRSGDLSVDLCASEDEGHARKVPRQVSPVVGVATRANRGESSTINLAKEHEVSFRNFATSRDNHGGQIWWSAAVYVSSYAHGT